jgi:hypothetical protein
VHVVPAIRPWSAVNAALDGTGSLVDMTAQIAQPSRGPIGPTLSLRSFSLAATVVAKAREYLWAVACDLI